MFKEHNVVRTIRAGIDTTHMEFKPLKDFCGHTIHVDGFFFTTGRFGEQVVVVGNGYLINMPGRSVGQFKEIASRPDEVKGVLEGHLLIKNIKMVETKNGQTTAYDLDDC